MGRFQCVYHLYLLKVIIYMNTTLVFNPKLLEKGLHIPLPLRTERKGSDPLFETNILKNIKQRKRAGWE